MTFRQNLACHVTPLLLRVVLAVTFLWAGLGKIMSQDVAVEQGNAQALVDIGSIDASQARDAGFDVDDPGATSPSPSDTPPSDDAQPPVDSTDDRTDGAPEEPADPDTDPRQPQDDLPREIQPQPDPPPAPTPGTNDDDPDARGGPLASNTARIVLVQDSPPLSGERSATAGTAASGIVLRRVHGLALGIRAASTPDDAGRALLPGAMGTGSNPVRIAWAIAVTEVVAGILLLLGFLTRLAALAVGGIMVGAIWMTEIGPPILDGSASLGFLPPHDPFDTGGWKNLLWQVALLLTSLGVLFSGAGFLSLDRLVFGPIGSKKDDD